MLVEEVVQRRPDPVAWSALDLCIVHGRVQTADIDELAPSGPDTRIPPGVTELVGDVVGVVVEVAAPVGPSDVVQDQQGQWRVVAARDITEQS